MSSIKYFAYGSNMLTERLQARCKSATMQCTAVADGYTLAFSKKSIDESGKATISCQSDKRHRVYGVVFDIDESDLRELDKIEGVGKGYDRIDHFQVIIDETDAALEVVTYIASSGHTDADLVPYDWYLGLVVTGARQHSLPSTYIALIETVHFMIDPKPGRLERLKALNVLRGFHCDPTPS